MKKFQYLALIAGVFVLFSFESDSLRPRPGKDYALFFAVQEYDTWGKLRNPVKDAEAIAKELKELYGFETEIVKNPTQKQIFDKIAAYRQIKFAEDAQLLIFFSGHGDYDDAAQEGFFIPKDGKLNDPIQNSYIPHTRLERQINSIPCKHILLAIDACYSGTFDKAIALSRDGSNFARPGAGDVNQQRQLFIDRALKYQSRVYLTSGAKERTPDPSEFARQFLAGLRNFGGDDQLLTFSELCGYMEKATPTPRFGEFEGNEPGGNFLFILQEAKPTTATTTAKIPLQEPPRTVEKAQRKIPDFVFVKGGTFQMGDQFGEGEADEIPVHTVTVGDFYMSQYEITVGDFKKFVDATGYKTIADEEGGGSSYDTSKNNSRPIFEKEANWQYDIPGNKRPLKEYNYPVIHISWYDAIEYCNWRSKEEGLSPVYKINKAVKDTNNLSTYDQIFYDKYKWSVEWNENANGYRLPTEAEWEYASREGGQKIRFGNGKNIANSNEINFASLADYEEEKFHYSKYTIKGKNRSMPIPVGSLNSPNSLGLYDMSGNVAEWCWDWYDDNYYSQSNNFVNPKGPNKGVSRVIRGGSWGAFAFLCRASSRKSMSPNNRSNFMYELGTGFRIVRQ